MHLSLTSRQTISLFYAVVLLSSGVFAAFTDPKVTTCCPKHPAKSAQGEIVNCTYVHSRRKCHEAYVLTMKNNRKHCISVHSKWMISKLEELKNQSRPCEGTPKESNWRK
ncbi:hypothetical protein AOLI_G00259200 [Acnodon oligacanthus]